MRLSYACMAALAAGLLSTQPQRAAAQTDSDTVAIAQRWVEEFNAAFNRRDAAGAATMYATDADHRASGGAFLRGRAEVEAFLARMFSSSPGVRQDLTLTSARAVGAELVFAEVEFEISGLADGRRVKGMATYILRRHDDRWLCVAGRSMIPI